MLLSVLTAGASPLCTEGDRPGGTKRNLIFVLTGNVIFFPFFFFQVEQGFQNKS